MRIHLIRHPRPLVEPGVCYGRLDVDCIDPAPIAAGLRDELPAGLPLFSSPLKRARCLAEALSGLLATSVRIDARLAEIDFGEWEGRSWDDIGREALAAWAADVRDFVPPNGESVAALERRALDFAATLREDAIVVAHAGILRALVGHWHGLPFAEWSRLEFAFGGLTVVEP